MPALVPELTQTRRVSVDFAVQQPSTIRNRIATLADDLIIISKFFRPYGAEVTGGGILYTMVTATDFFTSDVEKRAPKSEYRVVEGSDPDPILALVEDYGGKFQVSDEQIIRNDVSYLDQQTIQLANTIARKLDVRALQAIGAIAGGLPGNTIVGNNWSTAKVVGPLAELTPSGSLPTADISAAQLAADLQEMGCRHDLLIVHPNQAHALRVAYADRLDEMLASAGVKLFASARLTPGTAWAVKSGDVGTVGFEKPLTVESWRDPATRAWWVQAFAVPAFAVDRPYNAKQLTKLAG